jgi:hypothetical protein
LDGRGADDDEPSSDETPESLLEALIAEQGVEPLADVAALAAPSVWHSDEDVESFIAVPSTPAGGGGEWGSCAGGLTASSRAVRHLAPAQLAGAMSLAPGR